MQPIKEKTHKWHVRFLKLALHISDWSKDNSTKVGAVIVGDNFEIRSVGYNGLPRGVDDLPPERHQRPEKYLWTEHAERNAIFNAARFGATTQRCSIYITHVPCAECARSIIQSGIDNVYWIKSSNTEFDDRWKDNYNKSLQMFSEAGVSYLEVDIDE